MVGFTHGNPFNVLLIYYFCMRMQNNFIYKLDVYQTLEDEKIFSHLYYYYDS